MSARSVRIFCSYAHEDKALMEELRKQVKDRNRNCILWCDMEIGAGQEWEKKILTHLHQDEIIFLLISPDFKASDFCCDIEMPVALERQSRGEADVIPILLRPVFWENPPYCHLQCTPTGAKPVILWVNRDEAFADIAGHIHSIINKRQLVLYIDDAKSCLRLGKREEARKACQLARNISYLDGTQSEELGNLFYYLESYEDAHDLYTKALELGKKGGDLYEKVGDALVKIEPSSLEILDQALEAYNQAIILESSGIRCIDISRKQSEAYFKRVEKQIRDKGNELALSGKPKDALVLYDEAIKLGKNNAFLHKEKGDALYHIHQIREALISYEEAVRLLENAINSLHDQEKREEYIEIKTRIIEDTIEPLRRGISDLLPKKDYNDLEDGSSTE